MITVEISDELERRLRLTAEANGVTPEQYAKQLLEVVLAPAGSHGKDAIHPSASELLAGYVAAFDSSTVFPDPRYHSAYGDILEEKFSRQRIVLPEWER